MSYYIDIIDTVSPLTQLVYELASGGGIELSWNGADAKDKLGIVSSELSFNMLDKTAQDAAFIQYYTGNETRFKVQVLNDADDSVLWQGFILPDLYSEPYKNGALFVNFTATDGIGRLKGKYLPEEYYSREKSVIDILCQCLRLTGLELDLYFAPAIDNYLVKKWQEIYIDGETFMDKDKKSDVYSILETLVKDMLCICFQADNRWYIEGINMRHVRNTTYKTYDANGNFIATVVYDRLVKKITPLETPDITIIPPYNEITVTHKKVMPELPKTASAEKNDGWAVVTGVVGEIYPTDWMGNGGYYGRCVATSYNTTVFSQVYFGGDPAVTWLQDDTKFISLRRKLYFAKGNKLNIQFDFSIVHPATGTKGNESTWENVMKYEILFNGAVLFSNFGGTVEDRENLVFSSGGTCKIEIEHVLVAEGLLDVRLYRPTGKVSTNGVLGVKLTGAEISVINFQEELSVTDLINDEFTVDALVELDYAEDKTGSSKGFRLAKLKEETTSVNEIVVNVLYGFVFEGKNYSVVQLDGANLIKENLYQVYRSGTRITILDVIYNFNDGEQMVVQTLDLYTSGSFTVKKYAIADVMDSRSHWAQWTDAFYKIENNSYLDTVANIYRRMFNVAHEKIDLTAKNAVKFNDIIQFHYVFLKEFHVLNCTWNLDKNESTLTIARANYKEFNVTNPDETNIPPIVVAADDVYIDEGVTTANLSASAYDPDGTIVAQQWTRTAGDAGEVFVDSALINAEVFNLTGNSYTFQIQVTDNSGATATDTINVIRTINYTVSLDLVDEIVKKKGDPRFLRSRYKLNISPALLPGYVLNFTGEFYMYVRGGLGKSLNYLKATAWYNFEKNGVLIEGKTISSPHPGKTIEETIPVSFNYISTDEIYVTLYVEKDTNSSIDRSDKFKADVQFRLQTVNITSGVGTLTGLPINKELLIEKDW